MTPTDKFAERARETAQDILDWLSENALWETQVGDLKGMSRRISRALEQATLEARIDEERNYGCGSTRIYRMNDLRARLAELEGKDGL